MKDGSAFFKWLEGALLQFAITVAGCVAALYLWKHVLGKVVLVN